MSNTDSPRIRHGELARKSRAIQSIKQILGLGEESYQMSLESPDEGGRATYKAEIQAYLKTCTIMSDSYVQWSSQLLLAAPEGVESDSYQSSLMAPTGAILLNTLERNSVKPIPQHLHAAAGKIRKLAAAKQRFLTELHSQLRADEKRTYGDMLSVCNPLLSAMPDLQLHETYYGMIEAWKMRSKLLIKPQEGKSEFEITQANAAAFKRVTELSRKALLPLLAVPEDAQRDSLAAKLMLASMVNRSHWEFLEFERLEHVAAQCLSRLVNGLQEKGNRLVPAYLEKSDFIEWLRKQFGQADFPGESDWRPLKTQHIERFYTQAAWVMQWEKLNFVQHDIKSEALLNMCTLHNAWSYCTREKHDIRVPDVKDFDLVNGRNPQRSEQVSFTRIMYQQRQLNTMLRSLQHAELNPLRIAGYTESNRNARRQLMHYIRSNLHNLSLAQWRSLSQGRGAVLVPLLLQQAEV